MNFQILRRLTGYLLLVTVLAATALAQKPVQQLKPSAERLRETVTYLASDALEGRRTGSPGANDAAHYIAGEFQRLGLQPGSPVVRGSRLKGELLARFQQRFPYVAEVGLGKGNVVSVRSNAKDTPIDLRAGEDWMPLGFSSNARIESTAAVFVSFGIVAGDLKRDDYADLNVRDKIAIALTGTPDGDNPHGQFARYEDPRWKVAAAKDKGAKALILLSQEEKFSDETLARLRYDNAGEAGLPVIVLAKPAAMRLLQSLARATYDVGKLDCGAEKKMADGSTVIPCGKITLVKHADGGMVAELPDGTKAPIGPNGQYSVNKFYGPNEFERFSWTLTVDVNRQEVAASNVIGILDGFDPQLKSEAIVIGAHYDHLGHGGEGSLAPRSGEVHHGADDNASGVAGLLELARIFSSQQPKPRRTIVFIAFSGEEEGLLGSNYYVNHPVVPLAKVTAMINMDMIGRLKDNKLIVGGVGTAPEWRGWLASANPPVGMTAVMRRPGSLDDRSEDLIKDLNLTLNEDGFGPSDHSSFYAKQIPVLFFFTGSHEDYHKPSDTADKINYEGEARIVALVGRMVQEVDRNDKRPSYAVAKRDSSGRAMGFKVYLGTIPNYAETNDGLLLDGVRDDSPAAKAGLKAGDKIVKLAGREVRNVYDYTYALGEMKAGQEYEVEIMRGGERLKLKLTPAARK